MLVSIGEVSRTKTIIIICGTFATRSPTLLSSLNWIISWMVIVARHIPLVRLQILCEYLESKDGCYKHIPSAYLPHIRED